ncbi:MAG: hypothetical protein ACNA8W_17850 [Bradymonadaceae bacterium]
MPGSLQVWFTLFIFTTARRLYTFSQVKRAAVEMGLTELASYITELIAEDEATMALEAEWNRGRKGRASTARGRAAEIDHSNDSLIGAIFSTVTRIKTTLNPSNPVHALAVEFLHHFFQDGASPVTRQTFEEQLVTMEKMLREWAGPFAEHVQKLQISLFVDQLKVQVPEFRTELENNPVPDISFSDVRVSRERGQENLNAVVARLLGEFYSTSPEHVEARRKLLGPVRDQNDRIAALRRTRRAGIPQHSIDVNPTTGEEYVVIDGEVIEDVDIVLPVEA